jgi:hypothetical protein
MATERRKLKKSSFKKTERARAKIFGMKHRLDSVYQVYSMNLNWPHLWGSGHWISLFVDSKKLKNLFLKNPNSWS